MPDDGRIRRALLFMPGDDLKKITKGAGSGVDTVIMDLEDAVALTNKAVARQTVLNALLDTNLEFRHTERLVRINPVDSGWQEQDVDGTIAGKPDGYVVPKVESAAQIKSLSADLAEAEQKQSIPTGHYKLLAIIETALGVVNLKEIASSDPRLVALMFGAEDLTSSIGGVRTTGSQEILYAQSAVVIHAAAYQLQAIDTPYVNFRDSEGLRAETEIVMKMGYTGKMAIHPAQIAVIESAFTPSDDEIKHARHLIAAHNAHQESGSGAFSYQGQMVDMPMIRAAQRVLARAKTAGNI